MKNLRYVPILLFSLFLINSCVGTRSGTIQVPDASYIEFIGKKSMSADQYGFYQENVFEAKIDNSAIITLELAKRGRDKFVRSVRYKVSPGSHDVKVYRNGNLIINKKIYIGNQETVQIEIL